MDVIASGLHTFVVIHPAPHEGSAGFREYGFAEKAWYLEGRQGIQGAIRALFWPTDSVVEVKKLAEADFKPDPEREMRIWRFVITEEGRDAMMRFLQSWYDPAKVIEVTDDAEYYSGRYAYHLFRGCHHYTARALRAAGLPIRPWWAFSRSLIAVQLDWAQRLQTEAGIEVNSKKGIITHDKNSSSR
jgi:hypothetical protein